MIAAKADVSDNFLHMYKHIGRVLEAGMDCSRFTTSPAQTAILDV